MDHPMRLVGNLVDGVATAAQGVVGSVVDGAGSVGEGVQRGLDGPFRSILGSGGPEQPLRIADRVIGGTLDAWENVVNKGGIESARLLGAGLQRGLDHPVENLMGGRAIGLGSRGLPKLF